MLLRAPLRGDGCENNSNFKILLLVLAEIDLNLNQWMKRKENVYTSPTIQNEIIKVMGVKLLRELSHDLQRSPFLSIMVDETTDVSNREQATVVIRSVEGFEVHKRFIGLYTVPSIDSNTIVGMIKDVLLLWTLFEFSCK